MRPAMECDDLKFPNCWEKSEFAKIPEKQFSGSVKDKQTLATLAQG